MVPTRLCVATHLHVQVCACSLRPVTRFRRIREPGEDRSTDVRTMEEGWSHRTGTATCCLRVRTATFPSTDSGICPPHARHLWSPGSGGACRRAGKTLPGLNICVLARLPSHCHCNTHLTSQAGSDCAPGLLASQRGAFAKTVRRCGCVRQAVHSHICLLWQMAGALRRRWMGVLRCMRGRRL